MNNIRSGNTVQWTDTTAHPPIIHEGIVNSGPIICYRVYDELGLKTVLVEKMRLTVIDTRSNNNNNKERNNRKTRKLRR